MDKERNECLGNKEAFGPSDACYDEEVVPRWQALCDASLCVFQEGWITGSY